MASRDDFDGQMSLFGMDDMDGIGITGGGDFYDEEEFLAEKKKSGKTRNIVEDKSGEIDEDAVDEQSAGDVNEVAAEGMDNRTAVRKPALPKLKIEGVFQCLTCGKLLTKTVEEDKSSAFCNCCNVTYTGNL